MDLERKRASLLGLGFIFLILFTSLSTVGYFYLLGCLASTPVSSLGDAACLVGGLMVEALVCCILYLSLARVKRMGLLLGCLVLALFVSSNLVQLGSLYFCSSLLPRLAVENLEFVGLFLTPTNVAYAAALILGFVGMPLGVAVWLNGRFGGEVGEFCSRRWGRLVVTAAVMVALLLLVPSSFCRRGRVPLARGSKGAFYPVLSLGETLAGPGRSIDARSAVALRGKDVRELRELFGFKVNPLQEYPLVKGEIYQGICPFGNGTVGRPNVVIFFTEGTSARTLGVYNQKFLQVTPNIDAFAGNSTVFYNYFNHTTATYRGLLGQTCSFYPKFGGVGGWHNNYENLPKTSYFCLTDLFRHNGYHTVFMGAETSSAAHTHDMMRILGFEDVLPAEEISKRYLGGEQPAKGWGLSDQQVYRGVVGFLKEHLRVGGRPILLAVYTEETHAWVDVGRDGVRFKDGSSNTLNTLHNLDDAFGKFWRFYLHSPLANNTVVVFTADHDHFQEKSYVSLMRRMGEEDYRPIFVDKIPLIIHDPTRKLPGAVDAHGANSLDLAPTLVHLLCLPNERNPFLGTSIFSMEERGLWLMGITSYNDKLFVTDEEGVHGPWSKEKRYRKAMKLAQRFIRYVHALDVSDRVWPIKHPERWGKPPLSPKEGVKRLLSRFPLPGGDDFLVYPGEGKLLRFDGFSSLPGLVIFVWRDDERASSYELRISLEGDGETKRWVVSLKRGDSKLLSNRGLVSTYYLFSRDSWNSLVPFKVRWQVVAKGEGGEVLWLSPERSFGFKPAVAREER